MTINESKRDFIESLRSRFTSDEFIDLLDCLDGDLGYRMEVLRYRLGTLTSENPGDRAHRGHEEAERVEYFYESGTWCDPFITLKPPPRRLDLDVDYLTDLIKYLYATLSRAIADLQYMLAELTGTGRLDPAANSELQWEWCYRQWEFLYHHTTGRVRNDTDTSDWDWDYHDNTYSTGKQVMSRLFVEPSETDDEWPYNEYLCGDGPIQEYRRDAVHDIAEPW